MVKQELEQFETNFYKKAQKEVFQKMILGMDQNRQMYLQQIKNGLIGALKTAVMIQKTFPVAIGSIQISLMRYSVLNLNPTVRIDVYGEAGILRESLCTAEIMIDWPAEGIRNLQEKAEEEIKSKIYQNRISQEDVKVLLMKSIDDIEHYFMESLRYKRKMIEGIEGIGEIEKGKDFYISAGGYMEKQVYIYTEREETDIFYNLNEDDLIYRKFENFAYENKVFENLDLEGAVFSHCIFEEFEFNHCRLLDVTFEHCTFRQGSFLTSDMRGCMFEYCTFYKVKQNENECNGLSGKNQILYRPLIYQECDMKRMNYVDCDLSYGKVANCNCRLIEIDKKSVVEKSDFLQWVSC